MTYIIEGVSNVDITSRRKDKKSNKNDLGHKSEESSVSFRNIYENELNKLRRKD